MLEMVCVHGSAVLLEGKGLVSDLLLYRLGERVNIHIYYIVPICRRYCCRLN